MLTPKLFPIQLALQVFTRSGHRRAVSRRPELLGVRGDPHVVHRDLALLDDGAVRQPRPSITCSFASTVLVDRSQFTVPVFFYTNPFSSMPQEQPLVPAVVVGEQVASSRSQSMASRATGAASS